MFLDDWGTKATNTLIMKELLENYFGKEVKYWTFKQYIEIKQYTDKEIYETDVEEPFYIVHFENGDKSDISLSDLLIFCFNKNKL